MAKPAITTSAGATIDTLSTVVDTSKDTLGITYDALGATIDSVEALSEMLNTTALTVEDTQPVVSQVNGLMGETLPATMQAATDGLVTAQAAATSLESAIYSFETFRAIVGATPLLSAFIPASDTTYSPEKPLAESLGAIAASLEELPTTFETMATNLESTDDNLALVQGNLETMSESVSLIADSLGEYQAMISNSQDSMDSLKGMLTSVESNLATILNIATIVLVAFFLWLLAAQVVIFSQGYELYQGTAGSMADGDGKSDGDEKSDRPKETNQNDIE
jgi:uncharacterized phage infection (PIP) family protein YhgE